MPFDLSSGAVAQGRSGAEEQTQRICGGAKGDSLPLGQGHLKDVNDQNGSF